MFEEKISFFKSYRDQPETIPLGKWLHACKSGSQYAKQVQAYRRTGDKALKKNLPLVTVGGVCDGGRKLENVTERTGWIALDIDGKDNPHLSDAEHLRDELANIANVAFSGLSTGGAGVWALVRVSDPSRQADHFEALKADFKNLFGITLDSTKGRNPNDARFYSFDPGAIIKDSYTVYEKLPPAPVRDVTRFHFENDTRSDVEALIQEIQSQRIDITDGYENWLKVGFALSDEFGETGREYFHAVSQFHPDYRERETDRQYTRCLKARGAGVTIASFFHACKTYGIQRYRGRVSHSKDRDRALDGKFQGGYPADWDEIEVPEPGTSEYREMEYYEAMDSDSLINATQ